MMAEEDKDESPHVDMDKTDEEAQDIGPAFDDNLDSEVNNFTIEEDDHVFMAMVHPVDVRGHPSISLPPLSFSTLPLFICTLPIPLYHIQEPKSDDFPDIDSLIVVDIPLPPPLIPQ
jgi:hypothetical protein